jgi:hypothetical protein
MNDLILLLKYAGHPKASQRILRRGTGDIIMGIISVFVITRGGSLDETVSHLRAAIDLDYCAKDIYEILRAQAEEIRKMLNGYIEWLKEKKIGDKEPGANLHVREDPAEYIVNPFEDQ